MRRVGELDNRGSHFYLGLYWARELVAQTDDPELAERFKPLAGRLAADEQQIVAELAEVQGQPVDIGGYYHPNLDLVAAAMRPSATLNDAVDRLSSAAG
jgi:isocitrate dehydrogenase